LFGTFWHLRGTLAPSQQRDRDNMTETKPKSGAIDGLFDIGEHEHAISVIGDWASFPDREYTDSYAKTIEAQLVAPLWEWIAEQGANANRRIDMLAAMELVECAENDIAYGFRYRQKVYPEHVKKLDYLWREFQRVVGAGAILEIDATKRKRSNTNRKNATGPRRRDVTKDELLKYKDEFESKNGRAWGWKTAAWLEFAIDFKTINDRISE
jgi:hypothetical protein